MSNRARLREEDPADILAGALKISRGYAIELMRNAVSTPVEVGEAAGIVGSMPGTSGFNMACFMAERVPVGTLLYPSSLVEQQAREIARLKAELEDAQENVEILAPFAHEVIELTSRLSRQGEVIKRAAEELGDLRHRFHMACISTGSDVWAADCACAKADAVIDELRSVEGV